MKNSDEDTEMSVAFADDNEIARSLIMAIAGDAWEGKGAALEAAYSALRRAFPQSKWTRRRVKGLYQGEAASVPFSQMRELAEVAVAEQERHAKLRKAREEHARYIAETTRLTAVAIGRTTHRARGEGARLRG